ncbi:MAG: hypothetical protein C7B46_20700 [Sulfobacillus benefaciens]|uniref:FAD/NAD(P)-binding domain-containing protein n=1 Tax=Sulfobacillus benefaciens TaxID=453960 RepID=A0A2T2WSS0_9FIRM|nr:MAG: hypothetical protein C7B46_20700 [Sulfobacillus benefaciens]
MSMDVAIVGGGPAGISAAIWCQRLGLAPTIYERESCLGGQLQQISLPIVDLPGQPEISATQVLHGLIAHIERMSIPIALQSRVIGWSGNTIHLQDGRRIFADRVIYAPGLKNRTLDIPGQEWISNAGTGEILAAQRSPILIVGGGDRALEAACRLAEAGIHVILVHWRKEFSARREFQERLQPLPVDIVREAQVTGITRGQSGYHVRISTGTQQQREVDVADILVRIGMEPDIEPGFAIPVSQEMVPSYPRHDLLVVGDATVAPAYRSLVAAYASGMQAAKFLVMNE